MRSPRELVGGDDAEQFPPRDPGDEQCRKQ